MISVNNSGENSQIPNTLSVPIVRNTPTPEQVLDSARFGRIDVSDTDFPHKHKKILNILEYHQKKPTDWQREAVRGPFRIDDGDVVEVLKKAGTTIREVDKSLNETQTPGEVIEHIGKLDRELFSSGRWGNFQIELTRDPYTGLDYYNTGEERVLFYNKALHPALRRIEGYSREMNHADKISIMESLTRYVCNNYGYYKVNQVEAALIAGSMLNVAGTDSFPYILRIIRHVTNYAYSVNNNDEDYIQKEERSETDPYVRSFYCDAKDYYYDTFLEFDEPSQYFCLAYLIKDVGTRQWLEEDKKSVVLFLCDIASLNSEGNVHNFADVFQSIGVEYSVPALLRNLESEDLFTRRMSAVILYRLEIGNVGITSSEGVEYFNKIYCLAKAGDEDFLVNLYKQGNAFVKRIDSEGSIGVFDGNKTLLGFFKLDLAAKGQKVDAPVFEIASKDVFLPKADETEEQRAEREKLLEFFLKQYEGLYGQIYEKTGIRLSNLKLYEQGWFVIYFSKASEDEKERFLKFLGDQGELGLKVFLALDYGGTGEEILNYSNSSRASQETQNEVLLNFYNISNRAFEWRKVFEKAEEGLPCTFSAEVHEALIRKSSEYFRSALAIEQGRGGDVDERELLRSMESVCFALDELRELYSDNSDLSLERTQKQAECADKECTHMIADARTTWSFVNNITGTRITVSVRPEQTFQQGNRPGGEARMNFRIVNKDKGFETRIGIDLSDYGEYIGIMGKPPVVSLDLGTGVIDKEADIYPSQRVGRVLGLVEGSEGGHNEASFSTSAALHFEAIAKGFNGYISGRFAQNENP